MGLGRQAEESGYHGATVTILIITIRAKTKPGEYKLGDFGPGSVMLPNVKMVEPCGPAAWLSRETWTPPCVSMSPLIYLTLLAPPPTPPS